MEQPLEVDDASIEDRPTEESIEEEKPQPSAPVGVVERVLALDVVRGMAVFGILFVNIESFGLVNAARRNPDVSGGEGPWNYAVWLGTVLLADTKFIAIFGMLFGAGMAIAYERRKAKRTRGFVTHYRRMAALLVMGMLHAHLIWDGDILFIYAVYGAVLYLVVRAPAWALFLLAMVGIVVDGLFLSSESWNAYGGFNHGEVEAWRSGWLEQMNYRIPAALRFELIVPIFFAPGGMGYMTLGMAMAKTGFITGRWPGRVYSVLAAAALPFGVMLMGASIEWGPHFRGDWVKQAIYWGSLSVTLGWIGWGISVAHSAPRWGITRRLASVGRMALTNYLMHSVICTLIFYGHGLGQFERMTRVELLGVVLGVCAFQLIASPLWLRFFRFGPVEWLWRMATYWKWQPILAR